MPGTCLQIPEAGGDDQIVCNKISFCPELQAMVMLQGSQCWASREADVAGYPQGSAGSKSLSFSVQFASTSINVHKFHEYIP